MVNPLAFKQEPESEGLGLGGIHEFCARNNARIERAWPDRWFYVAKNPDTGFSEVRTLDGEQALATRRAGEGWEPDYYGWTRESLASEGRLLRWFFRQGQSLVELTPQTNRTGE